MKFQAISDNSRKLDLNWDHINIYVSKWKPHTPFDVEITRRQAKKSDPLRKYYFAVVIREYMKELGYDAHELELFHSQLKIVYFTVQPDNKGIYRNVPSVFSNDSDLDVSVKKEFVDWVVRKAAQDGCYIPDPD
jgi:hypothetical protein